jgi:hypothetical protein
VAVLTKALATSGAEDIENDAQNASKEKMKKITYKNFSLSDRMNELPMPKEFHPVSLPRASAVLSSDELRGIIMEMLG